MSGPSWPGRILACLCLLPLAACAPAPTPTRPARLGRPAEGLLHAEPWPEADALFRSDPRWLGSDDAYSVDLGEGRVLWLFADTFIAASERYVRREATMVRNSVAIQSGRDPSRAAIRFHWRTQGGRPGSFFPEQGGTWFWPGHGIVVGDRLLILLMAVRASSEGLGFENVGWRAVSVDNYEQPPLDWRLEWLETPENPFGLIVSGSVLQMDDHLWAYSVQEPSHTVHLVRWPLGRAKKGDLSEPRWWAGEERGWVRQGDLVVKPQRLFSDGQVEFTVHHEPRLGRYMEVQTIGFPKADLGFRLADAPTGPWTPARIFYRPEEFTIPEVMIYAAKAHPHLAGADLVLTYATNSSDFAQLVAREDLYYPRFLRVRFAELE